MFRAFGSKKFWSGNLPIIIAIALGILVLAGNVALACNDVKLLDFKGLKAKITGDKAVIKAEAKTQQQPTKTTVSAEVAKPKVPETSDEEASTEAATEAADKLVADIWHFYNLDLQDDEDKLNDYNFGPNPMLEQVSMDKVKEAIEGKKATDTIKVQDIIDMMDMDQVKAELIKRMHNDPKLAAAVMAWMDCQLGTRFMGVFYSESKEKWDVAINLAADTWIADPAKFVEVMTNFEKKLDHANKVELRYVKSGLTDQMYMEPDGMNPGIPDVIVMETDKHDGWFIVFTYIIKETKTIEVGYRVDCGFQPCNVAKVMKITPKKNPNNPTPTPVNKTVVPVNPIPTLKTPTFPTVNPNPNPPKPDPKPNPPKPDPKPDPPKPDPKPDPPKPDPKPDPPKPDPPKPDPPTPDPDPKKDPTKGTPVLPNDDPGPGENTNNPSNPNQSTADQPTNSNHMTQDEYDKAMEENKSANEPGGGSEGGTPNTPSTPAPTEDTKVDSNADSGTGNGGIDAPTEVQESTVSDDPAGDAWDGPPD